MDNGQQVLIGENIHRIVDIALTPSPQFSKGNL